VCGLCIFITDKKLPDEACSKLKHVVSYLILIRIIVVLAEKVFCIYYVHSESADKNYKFVVTCSAYIQRQLK
jgi:hypothetical protein